MKKHRRSGATYQIATTKRAEMTRPIQRIGDKTYSATWFRVNGPDGEEATACVVFDDTFQERYSDIPLPDHKPFSDLPFSLSLQGKAWPESVLSADAYMNHVIEGTEFPDPWQVFDAMSSAIDNFVDFDEGFASQKDLSDFCTCWAFSTYATDVLDTVGYMWPTGEKGSGKTQCLKVLMHLSFMGTTVTSSSSFAAIRDDASLGATLGFDDCENVRGMEPNKRELLLAGNTDGTFVTLKVQGKREGDWDTRRVNAFAPRAFTSISLPDSTLASRTIMLELKRSTDIEKTRRKPTNQGDWEVAPSLIRDKAWLNVTKDLVAIEAAKQRVNETSNVAGRDFDIFQGPLTIAKWLEDKSSVNAGLFDRMLGVMKAYLDSRNENQLPSLEDLVLTVLVEAIGESHQPSLTLPTGSIAHYVKTKCGELDITDESLADPDVQTVGLLMKRLGFKKSPSHGSGRSWIIERDLVAKRSKSTGLIEPPSMETPVNDQSRSEPVTIEDITQLPISDDNPWG